MESKNGGTWVVVLPKNENKIQIGVFEDPSTRALCFVSPDEARHVATLLNAAADNVEERRDAGARKVHAAACSASGRVVNWDDARAAIKDHYRAMAKELGIT